MIECAMFLFGVVVWIALGMGMFAATRGSGFGVHPPEPPPKPTRKDDANTK